MLMMSHCGGWLLSCVVNVLSVDTLENPIVMKLCPNVCLDNIKAKFDSLDGSKSWSPRCNLRLALVTFQRPYL